MQAQFKEAQQYVQEQQNQGVLPPESVRGRIYGLGKQSTEGDCRMPCPPA
jgi:acyl-CoA-binding protein